MTNNAKKGFWVGAGVVVILLIVWFVNRPTYDYPDKVSPRPILGSSTASIVVEEYSDFQCPACKQAESVAKEVQTTFGDKIAFYYKHFPLTQIHVMAFRAASASECANDQGKFWEYHDQLFLNQPQSSIDLAKFSDDALIGYAGTLGLDTNSFTQCLKSRSKDNVVRDDMHSGNIKNIQGTPTFFVNGVVVEDWSKLREVIQSKLIGG